jgi:hypothetical protein
MSRLKEFITLASLSTILSHSTPPLRPSEPAIIDDSIDMPSRAAPVPESPNPARVQRKPAVEPRVYVEDLSSKSGYVYYDYTDQSRTREQSPPATAR